MTPQLSESISASALQAHPPTLVLCKGLEISSTDTKLGLAQEAFSIHSSEQTRRVAAATICHSVFKIAVLAPEHWAQFCEDNFGFIGSTARKYRAIGEMLETYIQSGGGGNDKSINGFLGLSKRALEALSHAPEESVGRLIQEVQDGATDVSKLDSNKVKAKLIGYAESDVSKLTADLAAAKAQIDALTESGSEDQEALANTRVALDRVSNQLKTSEDELLRAKDAEHKNRTQTQPRVEVVEAPPSVLKEVETRVKESQAKLDSLNTEIAQKKAVHDRLNESLLASKDSTDLTARLRNDVADLLVKYPLTLIQKLVASDPRVKVELKIIGESLVSLGKQVSA